MQNFMVLISHDMQNFMVLISHEMQNLDIWK